MPRHVLLDATYAEFYVAEIVNCSKSVNLFEELKFVSLRSCFKDVIGLSRPMLSLG